MQTKNSRPRIIAVLPDLIEDTWEYVEGGPRQSILDRFGRRYPERQVPNEIFLSEKTGLGITDKAISNIFTRLFFGAGVEGHGHRLRATHLVCLFEARLDAEEARMVSLGRSRSEVDSELVLRMVADQAGHKNIESLRPYLNLARKRRRNREEVEEAVTLEQTIAYRKAELVVLQARKTALCEEIVSLTAKGGGNGNQG